ncbi:unnamed protein product [Cylindrotheca closterium]|uniref:Orc1-like AAA ATPase domain-containing protein n=1 Tax=Cylindrotheca closterium TaxID=2856 RepID=A0AAD2FP73_9STRA|nr:unnamed protein product [Cylindrotheca closterium]
MDSSIIEDELPFQLSELKPSDDNDDEPSEFGDDDALLSVAPDGSDDRYSHSGTQEKGSQTGTQTKSSQEGTQTINTSTNRSGSDSPSVSASVLTGIKTAEVRKSKNIVPITSQHHKNSNLNRKSLEHVSDFSLDGLVGRDSEVSQLKSCFDRMVGEATNNAAEIYSNGAPLSSSKFCLSNKEVVLISGPGGMGKSRVARTLKDELGETGGFFAEGKFDMNSTDEPYSAIANAFGKICQHIKNETPDAIPTIRQTIEKQLGDEVQLLVQLIPDLSDLLKDEHESIRHSNIDITGLENGLDRMRYAFRVLTRLFTKECTPMVVFLDDLQWADLSSLQMLEFLTTDTQNPNPMMILGCYRSEEVDENSLLYNKIVAMRKQRDRHRFLMTEIEVGPFESHNIEEVITMAAPCANQEDCRKLAELCLKRTLGNVFFVLEFLRMLQLEALVQYDFSTRKWSWDLAKIEEATMSTANVAVLLKERMRKLPQEVQAFLQCSAYLGSTFSVASITAVWNTYGRRLTEGEMQKVPALLDTILEKDFVEKYGARHYRWVHDKIQEAALDVRPIRESFQLDIGTSLYYSLDPVHLEEDLFAVVDLINAGNVMKRPEYAEVNLRAAQKAMAVSAYTAASKYASHGIDLLEKNKWVESRSLTVKLYTISAETEIVLGNAVVAEERCEEVLSHEAVSDAEKLPLKLTKERILSSVQMQLGAARDYCLEMLKELGCVLFRTKLMIPVQALRKSLATIKKLKAFPKESYDTMGTIQDRKQKAIVHLLSRVMYLCLADGDFMLSQLATCKMIDMTFQFGIHEASAACLSSLSLLVVSINHDYETGFRFAETALHLIERSGNLRNGETIMIAYTSAMAWKRLLEEINPQFFVSYTEALRIGDTEYALWGLMAHDVFIPYQLGRPLNDILEDCPNMMLQCEEASQSLHILSLRVYKQMLLILKTMPSTATPELKGEEFSIAKNREEEDKANLPNIVYCEGELHFFSADHEAAAKRALKLGDNFERSVGASFMVFIETYHRAACLYAAAIKTNQRKYKGAAKKLRNRMDKWEKRGNPNVMYYVQHLNAEQAVLDKRFDDADQLYKDAIETVTALKHLHHAGYICERYANFLELDRVREPLRLSFNSFLIRILTPYNMGMPHLTRKACLPGNSAKWCRLMSSSSSSSSSSSNHNGIQHFSSSSSSDGYGKRFKNPSQQKYWAYNRATGRHQRPIFVAATKQHVGKTTTSLAIMSGLKKRFDKVGFIKPVGQQHVAVPSSKGSDEMIRVDKDVVLVREHFGLDHINYQDMSPVIVPRGYTRDYVDGKISFDDQVEAVESSMAHIAEKSDAVLIEGTGHCAVGSIVGLNNAKVASLLGADMVLIANGGLGKAFDELELNRILCQHYGVRIAGVVINKVIPEKYEQTKKYIAKAMMQTWGIPLLGCIPDRPFLGCPALADLERLFGTKLLSGGDLRLRHYNTSDVNIVTTSLTRFLENLRQKPARTLYICHVTRDDLIVGFLGEFQRAKTSTKSDRKFEAALIVCGREGKYSYSKEVMEMIDGHPECPIMAVQKTTHEALKEIHNFTPKLNIDDTNRVQVAVNHYEPYIDFEELMRRTTSSNSSFNEPGAPSLEEIMRL